MSTAYQILYSAFLFHSFSFYCLPFDEFIINSLSLGLALPYHQHNFIVFTQGTRPNLFLFTCLQTIDKNQFIVYLCKI